MGTATRATLLLLSTAQHVSSISCRLWSQFDTQNESMGIRDWAKIFRRKKKHPDPTSSPSSSASPSSTNPAAPIVAPGPSSPPLPTPTPHLKAPTLSADSASPPTSPPANTTSTNTLSTTVGNGLIVGLGLLEKAVTGIGVPGLEAAVNGVVGIIELIKDVKDNANDLGDLNSLISSLANAISMAPNLHPGVDTPESLLLRLNGFLLELHGMLTEVQQMLGVKNIANRAANSQAHKEAIEGVKEKLRFLLSRFSTEGIISLELNMASTQRTVQSIDRALAVTQEHVLLTHNAQEYENLINAIPRVHARYNDTAAKPTRPCHPGTRTGLLQIIRKWIDEDPEATPYFWLCGEVGVGKSTVAHTIAEEQEALGQLGSSFFFSRHDDGRRTPHLLFPSIAYQLARFDQGIYNALAKALKPDPDIVKRSLMEQFKRLILQPLAQGGLNPSRTVVIIIDGLDECTDPASILNVLTLGIGEVGVRLRVLISSRPYAAILSKFKDPRLFHLTSETQFHDINPQTLSDDVAAYLSWSLAAVAMGSNLPSRWPPKEQLEELIRRAAGLFIIASTYTKYIEDPEEGNPPGQLARILSRQGRTGPSPLAELDALYDQVLDDLKSKLPSEVVNARDIIAFAILAPDGINVAELAGLFHANPSYVRSVLRRLTAVILLPEDDTGNIAPFHASFGEYIQDPTRCTIRELSVDGEAAYGRIAVRCSDAIVSTVKDGIIGVEYDSASGNPWIPAHLVHSVHDLSVYLLHSSHAQVEEVRRSIIETGIWAVFGIITTIWMAGWSVRLADAVGGFDDLAPIKGSHEEERSMSLGLLMIENYISEFNRMSEKATIARETFEIETSQPIRCQALEFTNLAEADRYKVDNALRIVRNVRCWAKYTHCNVISFKGIDIKFDDKNLPQVVLVFVASPIGVQLSSSLYDYLEKNSDLDMASRVRMALGIADGLCYLHGSSPPQPHSGINPHQIMVSAEGKPILYPSRWHIGFQSNTSPDEKDEINGITCQSDMYFLPPGWYHWNPTGDAWQLSLEARLQVDVWDFGSILYQMITGEKPLATYKRLADGNGTLGSDADSEEEAEDYWKDPENYEARYAPAVSLLVDLLKASDDLKELLKSCWSITPQARPPMSEVFERLKAIVESMEREATLLESIATNLSPDAGDL